MLKKKLYNILDDLNKMQGHDVAIKRCVNNRLNTSLMQYVKDLSHSYTYIVSKNATRVIKRVSKIYSEENKDD